MQRSFAPMHASTNRASLVRCPLGASPSPRCCRAAVPAQGRRTTMPLVAVAAGANPGPSSVTTSHPASSPSVSGRAAARQHLPVISLLSACVEVNDACRQFEQAAGRSAMVGFVVAVAVELVTNQGLFDHWSAGGLLMFSATASLCVLAGAAVASMDQERPLLNLKLREAVLSSLTAAKRSSASVTQAQVDKPVDYLMETAFAELVFNVFEEEFLA